MTGHTTTAQVEAAGRTYDDARARLLAAENALAVRRGGLAAAQDDVAWWARVLADADLFAAGEAADEALARAGTAEADLRRCRNPATTLAGERRQAVSLTRAKAASARAALVLHCDRLGVELEEGDRQIVHGMRSAARRAAELATVGDLPCEVGRCAGACETAHAALEDARARLVPEATVAALARGLPEPAVRLLARLVGGYEPTSKTCAGDLADRLAALAGAGLVTLGPRVTPMGDEVARWVARFMPAALPTAALPTLSGLPWRTAHEPEERAAMAARALAALATVAEDGGGADLVEVGDPADGYSYRLARRADVLQWFVRACGGAA